MKHAYILASFFLASYSCADERVTDHAVLYYNDLSLISKNGTCILHSTASSKTTKIVLSLKPPCYFLRKQDGKELKHYSYPRRDADFVVLMFGNPLSEDKRKTWDLKEEDICGGSTQGLIIHNNAVRISKKTDIDTPKTYETPSHSRSTRESAATAPAFPTAPRSAPAH